MAYETIAELPPAQVDLYNDEQKKAFLAAVNAALEEYDGDEARAIEIAHAAARGTPGER